MKTRNYSLPLVVLAALAFGSNSFAQQVAHYQLLAYLEKMPAVPVFPDSTVLASTEPTNFEGHEDLNAIQNKLQSMVVTIPANGAQIGAVGQVMKESSPAIEQDYPSIKQKVDSLQMAMKQMQAIKIEFTANFQRLENIYNQNVDKVEQAARTLQMDHPCKDDMDCKLEHMRLRNRGLIGAAKEKILNEEYLLSVLIAQITPSFASMDAILLNSGYGEGSDDKGIPKYFWGAQQTQLMLLSEIIERIKLERIQISNCARLAQQGYRRK